MHFVESITLTPNKKYLKIIYKEPLVAPRDIYCLYEIVLVKEITSFYIEYVKTSDSGPIYKLHVFTKHNHSDILCAFTNRFDADNCFNILCSLGDTEPLCNTLN